MMNFPLKSIFSINIDMFLGSEIQSIKSLPHQIIWLICNSFYIIGRRHCRSDSEIVVLCCIWSVCATMSVFISAKPFSKGTATERRKAIKVPQCCCLLTSFHLIDGYFTACFPTASFSFDWLSDAVLWFPATLGILGPRRPLVLTENMRTEYLSLFLPSLPFLHPPWTLNARGKQ